MNYANHKFDDTQLVLDQLGTRTAFIFVTAIIGGHESMAINIIKKFNENCTIDSFIPSKNESLKKAFALNYLSYQLHNVNHKKGEIVQSFFNFSYRKKAEKLLLELNEQYDSLVIIQGDIEQGSIFLLMANKLNINVISYIPYTHSFREMGSKFWMIKDFLSPWVYRSCQNYITIARVFKEKLKAYNPKANIFILENFILKKVDLNSHSLTKYDSQTINLFIIGRIIFSQKGHDILVKSLSRIEPDFPSGKTISLHIVGNGPDLEKLKSMVANELKKTKVIFYGWVNNVWELDVLPDLVIMPSRFEGVPLVMLESLQYHIPVFSSARDGMLDYLPESHLFSGKNDQERINNLALLLKSFLSGRININLSTKL